MKSTAIAAPGSATTGSARFGDPVERCTMKRQIWTPYSCYHVSRIYIAHARCMALYGTINHGLEVTESVS